MIVGFSLMKVSFWKNSVAPPNTTTITAETTAITGNRRVNAYEITSAARMATMNTAVATKMPERSPVATAAGMSGAIHGSNSAGLALAKKNSSSGPRSSASLSIGLSCGRSFMRCV